jgi:hypothetical protein
MLNKTRSLTAKMNTGDSEIDGDDFKLLNSNGEPVIYLTNNVTVNKLVFSFINNTGDTLILKGGKPAKPNQSLGYPKKQLLATAGDVSTFNFDFRQLLSLTAAKDVTIDLLAGWDFVFFPGTKTYPHSWSLAPSAVDTTNDTAIRQFKGGKGPLAMALSDACDVLFVATYCEKTIVLIDLINNVVLGPPLDRGPIGCPFDMVVSDQKDQYRIFVGKEHYPDRIACVKGQSPGIDVTGYMILKP